MFFDMIENHDVSNSDVDTESPNQHTDEEINQPVEKNDDKDDSQNDDNQTNDSQNDDDNQKSNHSIKKHEISAVTNHSFNSINFFDDKQLVAAENFLSKVMRSNKSGISSVNDGLAVLMRAQDLKLPFSTCIEHIHVINGKTGVDIHIIKALLLRAGCTWRCLKDYQPLYEYTDGINVYNDGSFPDYAVRCNNQKEAEEKAKADIAKGIDDFVYIYPVKWYKDLNNNIYKDYQLNSRQFGIAINKQQFTEIAKSNRIPVYRIPNVPVDYITEYEINRVINGQKVNAIGKFTYNDALMAGMFEKDTYKKYPRILIGHRAFTYAAREIASDILFGVMETTELKIISDTEISSKDLEEIEEAEVIEI